MIESTFGNLLNSHRERKKLKLETLAEKADVSSSYISLLIRGKKGRPSDRIIEQLAQALELTEDEKVEFQAAAEVSKVDSSPTKLDLPYEAGIEAVHQSLSRELLEEYFPNANKVRIQDSWLEDLLTYNSLLRQLLKSERSDLEIKILLLNPTAEFVKFREKILEMHEEGYLSDQINRAIEIFKRIDNDFGNKYIELRLFRVLPSVQHIAFDETIFIGFNSHIARSQTTYQLQIREKSRLGSFFLRDFEKVWKMAEPKIIPKRA
jgi:transcriptional regulator with XRE-family HTH domain